MAQPAPTPLAITDPDGDTLFGTFHADGPAAVFSTPHGNPVGLTPDDLRGLIAWATAVLEATAAEPPRVVKAIADQPAFGGKVPLACPRCGSADSLFSQERTVILYPVRMSVESDPRPGFTYTGADRIVVDEGTVYTGDLYCRSCITAVAETDLIPEYDVSGERGPMAPPAPQHEGQPPHAFPVAIAHETSCTVCGRDVEYTGTDEPEVPRAVSGIWSHVDSGDYFCAADAGEDDPASDEERADDVEARRTGGTFVGRYLHD